MTSKILQKYMITSFVFSQKKPKTPASFFEIAKKHVFKGVGKKENLALRIDRILYGKDHKQLLRYYKSTQA